MLEISGESRWALCCDPCSVGRDILVGLLLVRRTSVLRRIDDQRSHGVVLAVDTSGVLWSAVVEGLDDLAEYLETTVPQHGWASLKSAARDTRQAEFTKWLGDNLARHPSGIDVLWFSLSDTGDEIALCLLRQKRVPTHDHDWGAYEQLAAIDVPQEILRPSAT